MINRSNELLFNKIKLTFLEKTLSFLFPYANTIKNIKTILTVYNKLSIEDKTANLERYAQQITSALEASKSKNNKFTDFKNELQKNCFNKPPIETEQNNPITPVP